MTEKVERRIGIATPDLSKEERGEYERNARVETRMTHGASRLGRFRADSALRIQFQRHLLAKLREAESLTGDAFGSICNLIEDLGAVEVARMLVDPIDLATPPTGFLRLLEHELGRLTIEQAIVDFADTGLFADEEINAAKARLSIFQSRRRR